MEDRFVSFRESNERYQIQKIMSSIGPELTVSQLVFVQRCIEDAKLNPQELTLKIIQNVHTGFRDTSN